MDSKSQLDNVTRVPTIMSPLHDRSLNNTKTGKFSFGGAGNTASTAMNNDLNTANNNEILIEEQDGV